MTKYPHIMAAAFGQPWAMEPAKLAALKEFFEAKAAGIRFTAEEISARTGGTGSPSRPSSTGAVAVISVFGVMAQHASQVEDISGPGGTSTDRVASSFRQAIDDQSIRAVVLNFDSPGGNVYGIRELADEIFAARGKKPIVAQVNSLAASAAYWVACSADELVITPNGQAGSIGVYALHEDRSALLEAMGVKVTFVSAGEHKTEGNPYEPLSEDAKAALQENIDAYYGAFVQSVARGRGVPVAKVKADFGQGRVYGAQKCVQVGMADRINTLDQTIARLGARGSSSPGGAGSSALLSNDARAKQHALRSQAQHRAGFTEDMRRRRHAQRLRSLS